MTYAEERAVSDTQSVVLTFANQHGSTAVRLTIAGPLQPDRQVSLTLVAVPKSSPAALLAGLREAGHIGRFGVELGPPTPFTFPATYLGKDLGWTPPEVADTTPFTLQRQDGWQVFTTAQAGERGFQIGLHPTDHRAAMVMPFDIEGEMVLAQLMTVWGRPNSW